jgi:phosphoglycerol transferase MdoB-like AlkP superfamily enzyme
MKNLVNLFGRYKVLVWVAGVFLAANFVVRLALLVFDGDLSHLLPQKLLPIIGVGFVYDLVALSYAIVPFAFLALLCRRSERGRRWFSRIAQFGLLILICVLVFTTFSEFIFWNEFSSRFNFIAVDYLIYTREVLGNIRESYPVGWIFSAIFLFALFLFYFLRKPIAKAGSLPALPFRQRLTIFIASLLMPLIGFFVVGDHLRDVLATTPEKELGANGPYEFFRAFRSNNLDYLSFYKVLEKPLVAAELQNAIRVNEPSAQFTDPATPIQRSIASKGPVKPWNVVMISIESLGSDYTEFFFKRFAAGEKSNIGVHPGLTPNLDSLAAQGIAFGSLYATGLRTVRGLEALTLSIPPTPGHAVPMRKKNAGLDSLGSVLKSKGYEPLYIYGGYSYFDNMRDFFERNSYTVIDRSAISKEQISHETVWGVADEDLFKLAIREMDARTKTAKPVFAHVMTTSNHRPFTYPAGRIDIASGTSRDGAVKYTDWALGEFVKEAKTKPWFKNTLFVFVADHTSHGRGKTALPPEHYRIPMVIYAPDLIKAAFIEKRASQIDVAPTIMGLLNQSYSSTFFGQDVLTIAPGKTEPEPLERAFLSNYLTVGYFEKNLVVELLPKRKVRVVDAFTGNGVADNESLVNRAVSFYQSASDLLITRGK